MIGVGVMTNCVSLHERATNQTTAYSDFGSEGHIGNEIM